MACFYVINQSSFGPPEADFREGIDLTNEYKN